MLGQYKRCAQCKKIEHYKNKTDAVCELCMRKNKKEEKKLETEKHSVLY